VNAGEKSENYLKAFLLREKAQGKKNTIFKKIKELSDDANLGNLTWKNKAEPYLANYDIPKLIEILGISKAKGTSKADISINGVRYSVKEIKWSPPAIVNHTSRPGFENVCKRVKTSILQLDKIIDEYWRLRKLGTIKEDTRTKDSNCPFSDYKNYLKPIIEYFIFIGTGRGDSKHLADKVLEIDYKSLPGKMRILERDQYFDVVWPKLRFSVRSKGMIPSYPDCKNSVSIKRWTMKRDGTYKGTLHIRVD